MNKIDEILNNLIERYPVLEASKDDIYHAYKILEECYLNGNKLLVAGNGGSAADAEHIVGELMKSFIKRRPLEENFKKKMIELDSEMGSVLAEKLEGTLPALSLNMNIGLNTAFLNDVDGLLILAQEVQGYVNPARFHCHQFLYQVTRLLSYCPSFGRQCQFRYMASN